MTTVARCPYCFSDLDASEAAVRCTRCSTPHHQACFLEHGRCVTLMCGCASFRTVEGVEVQARRHLEVQLGPARHFFHVRAGYKYGEPAWLDVEAHRPELATVLVPEIQVGIAVPYFLPGEDVVGEVLLRLPAALQARGVRLVLRAEQTSVGSVVPKTLLEREAVLAGKPWEGHLRALGLAVKKVLRIDQEQDLIWLTAGVTRWSFRFRLDPLHPVRPEEEPVSVLSELVAYVDVPAQSDLAGRRSLPIVRPKP